MIDNTKRFYILDLSGDYYRRGSRAGLVRARGAEEADTFSLTEANKYISGKKGRFYSVIEAEEAHQDVEETTYEAPELNQSNIPTAYDTLHNKWDELLTSLCYMKDHIGEYQENLKSMLSDIDKEICDIMHYLELNELDDEAMLKASKMLQERRRHRREVKDEMEKSALMKSTFLDGIFEVKVQQSLEFMERMKARRYTPRKLYELFDTEKLSA